MAPGIWNTLPECTHNATSLQNFKLQITKWSGINRIENELGAFIFYVVANNWLQGQLRLDQLCFKAEWYR